MVKKILTTKVLVLFIVFFIAHPYTSHAIFGLEKMFGGEPCLKEEIVKDRKIQQEYVRDLALMSPDITSFVNNAYRVKLIDKRGYIEVGEKYYSTTAFGPFYDMETYKIYCFAKKGQLYKWDSRFHETGGSGHMYYVCETGDSIDSALHVFFDSLKRQANGAYEHEVGYYTGPRFSQLLSERTEKLHYSDDDGNVMLTPFRALDRNYSNDTGYYSIYVRLRNNDNVPMEINFFNIKMVNQGYVYDVHPEGAFRTKNPGEKIHWAFLSSDSFLDHKNRTRLRLNPNQVFEGLFIASVGGFKTENLAGVMVVIDTMRFGPLKSDTVGDQYRFNKIPQ